MTTQEKTALIKKIVANQEDNRAAIKAAAISEGLEPLVIEALNTALKTDLALVFAFKPTALG